MRLAIAFVLTWGCLPTIGFGTLVPCPQLCARLQQNAVMLVGEVIESAPPEQPKGLRRQRVRVQERLWGLADDVTEVELFDHVEYPRGQRYFFDLIKRDGKLYKERCGFIGPASYPLLVEQIEYLRKSQSQPDAHGEVTVRADELDDAVVTLHGPVQRQATSKRGIAAFADVPPGTYRIAFHHPAYEINPVLPFGDVVTVAPHSCATPNLFLRPTLSISGVTVDEQGNRVANVALLLNEANRRLPAVEGASDAEGNFRFERLHPGAFRLSTFGPLPVIFYDGKLRQSDATIIDLRTYSSADAVRMVLREAGARRTARIHVTDEAGNPMAGAVIANYNTGGEYSMVEKGVRTDAAGAAQLALFEHAHYILRIDGTLPGGFRGSVWKDLPPGRGDVEVRIKIAPGVSAAP